MIRAGDRIINHSENWSATVLTVATLCLTVRVNGLLIIIFKDAIRAGSKAGNWEVIT